jgi:hypothetical protein
VADSVPFAVSYRDALHLMADLRAMGETNALADRHRRVPPRRLFARAAALLAQDAAAPDGRLPVTFEMIFLAGWAPAASQPKPLRPGSAVTRLADALGALVPFVAEASPQAEIDPAPNAVISPSDDP